MRFASCEQSERIMATQLPLHICEANASLTTSHFCVILIPRKVVAIMSWKDDFKKSFDRIYEIVRRKYPDIRFPCYGGRFYWFLITRHFESLYFYLTENSLIYTASSAYITEISFDTIKKLSIKRGLFVKSSIHIRIVADKKYHLLLKDMKWLSARKTGNNEDNIQGFIQMLQTSVKNNK